MVSIEYGIYIRPGYYKVIVKGKYIGHYMSIDDAREAVNLALIGIYDKNY